MVDAETPALVGRTACVPNGTVTVGGACARGVAGPTTGFDDCVAGAYCINGRCEPVCAVAAATPCGTAGTCTRYSGVFGNEDVDPT